MLELEDGSRLKHWQLGTQSDSMRAANALLHDALSQDGARNRFGAPTVPFHVAQQMLRRLGDDATRPNGVDLRQLQLAAREVDEQRRELTAGEDYIVDDHD